MKQDQQKFNHTDYPTSMPSAVNGSLQHSNLKSTTLPNNTNNIDNQNVLINWLLSLGKLEDQAERRQRYYTLSQVVYIITACYPRALVLATGSTPLNTYLRGCDIDILVIMPSDDKDITTITKDFSDSLSKHQSVIARINQTNGITVLSFFYPIENFISHKIDVIFAKADELTFSALTDYRVAPTMLVDIHSVRAINGYRMVLYIDRVVINKKAFRYALMAIKSWAKDHNCYGNRGKFGGIVWTVMMARISVMFPEATPLRLLYLFFNMYSYWPWPKPVVIESIDDGPNVIDIKSGLLYLAENSSPMPVICPVYPYENMTSMVKVTDALHILKNMREALTILDRIRCGKHGWETFFSLI
ncbi:hypothetical protein GJ496_011227 [Pomphorhynchus laevis]|nr:hypothetical protein GJ496_011227 [Pomphorhynchus laevis]